MPSQMLSLSRSTPGVGQVSNNDYQYKLVSFILLYIYKKKKGDSLWFQLMSHGSERVKRFTSKLYRPNQGGSSRARRLIPFRTNFLFSRYVNYAIDPEIFFFSLSLSLVPDGEDVAKVE